MHIAKSKTCGKNDIEVVQPVIDLPTTEAVYESIDY